MVAEQIAADRAAWALATAGRIVLAGFAVNGRVGFWPNASAPRAFAIGSHSAPGRAVSARQALRLAADWPQVTGSDGS